MRIQGYVPRGLRPAGRVVMFHYGRSGSTVVADRLGQHPRIRWDDEVFQRAFTGQLPEARLTEDPGLQLRLRAARSLGRWYGFELKAHRAYHLTEAILDRSEEEMLRWLEHLGFDRFVVLERRNYLRHQVSEETGRVRGRVWHVPAGTDPGLQRIHLDVDEVRFGGWRLPLLDSFEARREGYRRLEQLLSSRRSLWLTYEDDVLPDPHIAYARICDFLGVAPRPGEIRRGRTNPFPLTEILTNHDEVGAALAGTPYEWMLAGDPEVAAS